MRCLRNILFCGVAIVAAAFARASAEPALIDSFEANDLAWRPSVGESIARVDRFELDAKAARTGAQGVAMVTTTDEFGYVNLTYDIGRAPIINELAASVWVRGDRPGVQLLARVVLPRSSAADAEEPVTFYVYGDVYKEIGVWRRLSIRDFVLQTSRMARKARLSRTGVIDERGAYVDQLVLRLRPGRSRAEFSIDDVALEGHIIAPPGDAVVEHALHRADEERDARVTPAQGSPPFDPPARETNDAAISLQGPTLVVAGKAFFPRVVDQSGESFEDLRRLGFNTVALRATVTAAQLKEARDAGLWVICPPPRIEQIEAGALSQSWSGVLAWNVGENLTGAEAQLIRRKTDAIRRHDPMRGRPIVGSAAAETRTLSRMLDILVVNGVDAQRVDPRGAVRAIESQLLDAKPGTPFWVRVPTQPPVEVTSQAALLSERVGAPRTPIRLNDGRIERAALIGLATGGNGVWFTSNSPIDASMENARRAREMERVNQLLAPLDPLVAVSKHTEVSVPPSAGVTGAMLRSAPGQVLMLFANDDAQAPPFMESNAAVAPQTVVIPGVPEASFVSHWCAAGLSPAAHRRVAGGIRVELGAPKPNHLLLIARDRKVMATLAATAAAQTARAVELQLASADELLANAGEHGPIRAAASERITRAKSKAREGDPLSAIDSASAATTLLQNAMHAAHRQLDGEGVDPSWATYDDASPLCVGLRAADNLSTYTENLIDGSLDDLAASHAAGWRHVRSGAPPGASGVAITQNGRRQGDACLRMHASQSSGRGRLSLWMAAPAAPCAKGDWIRVSAWARVDAADGQGSLRVIDSFGGAPLAIELGPTSDWRRVVFHRVAPRDELLRVTFALDGVGAVWLDDVRVERVQRSTQNRAAARPTPLFTPPAITR